MMVRGVQTSGYPEMIQSDCDCPWRKAGTEKKNEQGVPNGENTSSTSIIRVHVVFARIKELLEFRCCS